MKFNGSALQIHNCFNLLELRCIDLVTNINLIFDFPTTDVHSYFYQRTGFWCFRWSYYFLLMGYDLIHSALMADPLFV